MSKALKLGNIMTLVSLTALPLAVCSSFAEARGVGAGFQTSLEVARSVGRATNSQAFQIPVRVARSVGRATNLQVTLPEMASQAGGVIVAERAPTQVRAGEAASLLEDLRAQIAAQPEATLQFQWRVTQPGEAK
ncbi:MAG: hypothetical protein ACREDV_09480 [Methylocella sp.]